MYRLHGKMMPDKVEASVCNCFRNMVISAQKVDHLFEIVHISGYWDIVDPGFELRVEELDHLRLHIQHK